MDSIPELGRSPGDRNVNALQYSCLVNPMEQRSLGNYSPWSPKRVGHNLVTETNKYDLRDHSYFVLNNICSLHRKCAMCMCVRERERPEV